MVRVSNMYGLLLVFYLVGGALECSPASHAGALAEKELECYSQEKMYDKTTDKCYKLLTRGPCTRGHWFVLEKPKKSLGGNSTMRGICVREMCKDGEIFWPSTNACVERKDKKRLCGNATGYELLTNVFGEGECACTRNPPRARITGDKAKHCYVLYSQGPCPPGKILGITGKSDLASCIPDPCHAEKLLRQLRGSLSRDGNLAKWSDGICYELGTKGPCLDGLTFKVHSSHKKPTCVSLTNSVFKLDKTRECYEDEGGACQQQIKNKIKIKSQTASEYKKTLIKKITGAKRKRSVRFHTSVKDKWIWKNR